jgi:hypothetical protein
MIVIGAALVGSAMAQSDHNNIDSGRPLRFDDAYSIAFRERALEFGLSLDTFRRRAANYGFKAEYKVGFAKNQDIGITFDPSYDGSARRFDAGNVEIAYFNGLRREIGDAPALAYRVELGLPTGRGSQGLDVKLRGIATKALGQYDKVHLNLDADLATNPRLGERKVAFGAILGYTNPLGYPKRFDTTMAAEFAVQQSRNNGQGFTGTIGFGVRRQLSPRTVFDLGIESDVFATRGATQSPFRLTVGYSVGF